MQRRDDPWRPSRGKFVSYSKKHYDRLLYERQQRIYAALEETSGGFQRIPYDLQERILREAGLYDMPARGYYVPDYTGKGGFY